MLERDSKLGLCERPGDGGVIVYPLGGFFRGVRLTEAESIKFGSRGRDLLWAALLIFLWVSVVYFASLFVDTYSKDAGRWFQHFANMQVYMMFAIQRPLRLFPTRSGAARTHDTPFDRERAGLEIVPRYPTSTVVVGVIFTALLIAIVYLFEVRPPASMDAVELSAKRAAALEFALLTTELFAGVIWRNARSARLLSQRAAPAER